MKNIDKISLENAYRLFAGFHKDAVRDLAGEFKEQDILKFAR
jgi:hypothetical protein